MSRDVTLQVNLAPFDVRHAELILAHQLRVWGGQVSEVLLVVDRAESEERKREEGGDMRAARAGLDDIIASTAAGHPGVRVIEVDTTPAVVARVADAFSPGRMPLADFRGRPFFAYLFGLLEARNPRVLHVDSDMLFGGGSQTWIDEAEAWLARDPTLVACNPLPGPPLERDELLDQEITPPERVAPRAFRFGHLSARVFLADVERWKTDLSPLPIIRTRGILRRIRGEMRRQPNFIPLEDVISNVMRSTGTARVDFLGEGDGMWSLHPLHRTERFYARLGELIERVEANDVTEDQRGRYDLIDSMLE
jgi:hypothetical protein